MDLIVTGASTIHLDAESFLVWPEGTFPFVAASLSGKPPGAPGVITRIDTKNAQLLS